MSAGADPGRGAPSAIGSDALSRPTGYRVAASPAVVLGLIVAGATLLRIYHLDYLSLWNDELFSAYYYKMGLHYMWGEGLQSESSPPLYYMAIAAWIRLFGTSEAALRSLSVAASSAAIVLVYLLGKEALGRRQALLAAALFAASPTQIYFAQEARPYALLFLPLAVVLLACLRYLRQPGGIGILAGYAAAAVLCVYLHATMVFFIAACGITVLGYLLIVDGYRVQRSTIAWILANAFVAALAVPEMIGMVIHVERGELAWIAPLNLHDIVAVASNIVAGMATPGIFPGGELAALVLGVLAFVLWRHPLSGRAAVVAIAIPGLYVGAVLVVSLVVQPIMLSRIFCWTGLPLSLLQAHGLCVRSRLRSLLAAAVAVTVGVGLYYQLDVNRDFKEPWRTVIRDFEPALARADLVVLAPGTDGLGLIYYAPHTQHVRAWLEETTPQAQDEVAHQPYGIAPITAAELVKELSGTARVVMVLRSGSAVFLSPILAHVPPPTQRFERRCLTGNGEYTSYPCGIMVLSWNE